MKQIYRLDITWSTSRGRDTYGYNICRLDCSVTRTRFRCMGGGYDMIGTVFGLWLAATHQEKLQALVKARESELEECGYQVPGYKRIPDLYGLTVHPQGMISLDGACGIESVQRIAQAMGLDSQSMYNRKGHTTGWLISEGSRHHA